MKSYYLKYLKYKSKYLNLLNVLKGGEEIGPKVFRAPLHCNPRNAQYETRDYVGKILSAEDCARELTNSDIVRRIDPTGLWSITMDYSCTISEVQDDPDYNSEYFNTHPMQLISRFGGNSFSKIIGYSEDSSKRNCENLPLLIRLIKRSVTAIDTLNAAGYRHNDLHLGNIVYDETTDSVRLMDFGRLVHNDGESDFNNYWNEIKNGIKPCVSIYPALADSLRLPLMRDIDTANYRELILSLPDL